MEILRKKLPPNMRTQFWEEFIDVIEEESITAMTAMSDKQNIYNIAEMDYDRMIEISEILDLSFNVSVNDSEDFLRSEIYSLPFRIKNKATPKLYKSFFQALEVRGQMFIYYWTGSQLIKFSQSLLKSINNVDPSKPYTFEAGENFSGFILEAVKLDTGLKLDEGWKLDSLTGKQNTNHLALEVVLDSAYTFGEGLAPSTSLAPSGLLAPKTNVRKLISSNYFSYLLDNIDVSKKATEVFHVGCQLTAIIDTSKVYDSSGYEYTMPDLILNGVTTDFNDSITDVSEIKYIAIGEGKQPLPSATIAEDQPTQLISKLAKLPILTEEKWEDTTWRGVSAEYLSGLVNDITIGTGDGITNVFTDTLLYTPIKPGFVKISFTSSLSDFEVYDNGHGIFDSQYASGTIDYGSGDIVFNTDFYYKNTYSVEATGDLTYSGNVGAINLEPGKVSVTYIIGGTKLIATDDGSGNLTGSSCTGTINYVSGGYSLTFSIAPAIGTAIDFIFNKKLTYTPDDETDIKIEYYFLNRPVEITEAGLLDEDNNLLAYATFPAVELDNVKQHLTMSFLVKKSTF